MKKPNKQQIKTILRIILIISVVVLIYGIYNMGVMKGAILGIYYAQEKHNSTVCEFLELERDVDGYCILTNESKYTNYVDCGYEKFKTIGKEELPRRLKFGFYLHRLVFKPVIGC